MTELLAPGQEDELREQQISHMRADTRWTFTAGALATVSVYWLVNGHLELGVTTGAASLLSLGTGMMKQEDLVATASERVQLEGTSPSIPASRTQKPKLLWSDRGNRAVYDYECAGDF